MATPTLTLPERFAIKMEELRRVPGAAPMAMLMWRLFVSLMRLRASLAERGPQQRACRDDAEVGTGRVGPPTPRLRTVRPPTPRLRTVPDGGGDRRGAAGGRDAGGRDAVSAAVAAAGGTPVIDGATEQDCIEDDGGVAAACERRPRERRHLAAMARIVAVLGNGSRVFEARFEKMGLTMWAELRRFRYEVETLPDCCRA